MGRLGASLTRGLQTALFIALLCASACSRKSAPPAPPPLPPEARPTVTGGPSAPGRVLFAAALLADGGVAWRGWLHLPVAGGKLARLPDSWRVPYEARVVTAARGGLLAWVGPRGEVGLAGPGGVRVVANDADPAVDPVLLGRSGSFLYARPTGDLVQIQDGRPTLVWQGDGGPIRGLAASPDAERIAFVRHGNELVTVELEKRETRIAYQAPQRRARLFFPRFVEDGGLLVRERTGSRARLVHIRPARGAPGEVPLPPGSLRAFLPLRDGRLALGLARRSDRVQMGEIFVQARDGSSRRRVVSLPRTLPFSLPSCDGRELLLLDESGSPNRLVAFPLGGGSLRVLTGPSLRIRGWDAWALLCPEAD